MDENEFSVVVGLADNQSELFELFDKVFLLQCSEEAFLSRIKERTNHNFGKHDSEKEMLLGYYKEFENDILEKGAISMNTDKPLDIVVDEIIKNITN